MTCRAASLLAALALAAAPAAALAQAITIDVESPVLRPGESTTVTMSAGFDPSDFAMAAVYTDFVASEGSTGWSDATVIRPLAGPGTSAGGPSATGWDGIIAGQPNFISVYADSRNPIEFWQIRFTAPTDVSSPFNIELSTMTERYDVYLRRDSSQSESRLADLTEGSATIRVVPAPASALVLALGAVALRRRR